MSKFSAGLKKAASAGIFTLAQYMKLEDLSEGKLGDSTVIYSDGRIRKVKNLGWLTRHSREVESFILIAASGAKHADGFLVAEMYDWPKKYPHFFVTQWASFAHAAYWLRRSLFDMRKITVLMPSEERRLQIGTIEYKEFVNKYYFG